jgi:DNA-binding IclR family transcriptional regulator
MSILELVLASGSGLRLAELAQAVDAPKSTVQGLAKGLVAEGYLRESDGRYLPGPAVGSLLVSGADTVPAVYRHTLEGLTSEWGETTMLSTLVGDSLVYLDAVQPEAFIRAAPQLHRRFPLWPRSAGKALLAFMEPRRLESYLRRNHPGPEVQAVRDELDAVRRTRVSIHAGEGPYPHVGIASPIVGPTGVATLAITVAGPLPRMESRLDVIGEALRTTIDALTSRAGGP